jgi:uncharacterized damage-inducible protein DinB
VYARPGSTVFLSQNAAMPILSNPQKMNTLTSLFQFKAWSNAELFDLLAALQGQKPPEALHSAVRILNHIFVVDEIFKAHLTGTAHAHTAANTEATPSIDELAFAVAALDDWYVRYAAAIAPDELTQQVAFAFTDGDAGHMSREEMLMHVITHGGYHRGQAGQMLRVNADATPPRDLYTRFLHSTQPARRLERPIDAPKVIA